ncbi:hypothetical protein [Pelagicoccus albus]|uniref:Uncharacterized protein n=1 Tax=Pelagicoccus albus TaxID=415222 RepID=A0A7X1B4T1_9BACT|nr:hypothetical protein [Pelagicoccus albus]MBC2605620.1 hypothetical protein [Pelagicoccus albus]
MSETPETEEMRELRNLLYQEIGKNLLRFQLLEILLKDLVSKSDLKIKGEEISKPQTEQQTLGGISTRFFDKVVSDIDSKLAELANHNTSQTTIFSGFRIKLEGEAKEEVTERMRKLVDERNDLVHTSLKTMDLETVESCRREIKTLQDQRVRIQREIVWLKSILEINSETMEKVFEELERPGFLHQIREET